MSYAINGNVKKASPYCEDDVSDEAFLRNRRTENTANSIEERQRELLLKRKEIEQRTIKSTEKSLSYLRSSEEVGVATAEELLRQREQLERTEKRLDDINSTLRFSQRHIQGIKSVFGGLKNFISGGKNLQNRDVKNPSESMSSTSSSSHGLHNNPLVQNPKDDSMHPGLRIHDFSLDDSQLPTNSNTQEVIDENLGQMLNSITKLKGLAHGLSEELNSQNDMIFNVIEKVDRADTTIHKQNKDINKLLK
ncbi:synaptosomal-associated protein 29 [Cimex lectularius]|uniref:t-SNARE coiled-coil homology domain-containing protein n=1 Tax=Cimex lectularius TaxID=79782 RepID=A0A8I6S9Q0_CIMLE|nr:synaptosomal-associated protein 29 [Cimex lectularius]